MRRHHESHEAANQRSLDVLDRERRSREGYSGEKTREAFTAAVKVAFNGNEPRGFQLDVAEALTLGLDSTVIAGTGSGKTLPWAIPLLLDENKDKMVLVISPLKALQVEHASFFRSLGIKAAPVNGDTWKKKAFRQNVKERKYQILLASPEMCFEVPEFSILLRDATWSKYIMFIVIDEAHCITQWGREFRLPYSTLDKLRSFLAPRAPLLATSATLAPPSLGDVRDTLEFQDDRSFDLNLGNDRSNIMPIVWPMKGGKGDFGSLDFVLNGGELHRTIIYVNEKETAREACEYLQALVPEKSSQIDFIHAGRCSGPQKRVLREFQAGEINVLFTTEVVGMGTDLKNVTLMVQYMVPTSLSVWVQRAGRAGRSGSPSCTVLLYEPSVVQRVNTQDNGDDEDDGSEPELSGDNFQKRNVEDSLRGYVMTEKCRRVLTDKYFDNPPRDKSGYSVPCCDNCLRDKNPEQTLSISDLLQAVFNPGGTVATPASQNEDVSDEGDEEMRLITDAGESTVSRDVIEGSDDEMEIDPEQNPNDQQQPGRKKRRGDRLADCRAFLLKWRDECWMRHYRLQLWGPNLVLPDALITKFATCSWVKTKEDVARELSSWVWVDEHSEEVLEGLAKIDAQYDEAQQMAEQKKAEEVAERRRLAGEKRRQAEEEREEAKRRKAEEREETKRRKAEEKEEAKRRKAEKEEAKKRKAEEKEETKKRKAEDRLRKREEKARQKEIEKEERKRESAQENRWQAEGEEDMWRQADLGMDEVDKRRRVGYHTFIEVPSPDPPPPPRPRPRPTKILPSRAAPTSNLPLDNGPMPIQSTVVAAMGTSPLLSVYPPPPTMPRPRPRPTKRLPPMDDQHNHTTPPLSIPFNDGVMPAHYQTHVLPIATSPLPPVYPYQPVTHPPPSGFIGPSAARNAPHPIGYSQYCNDPLPLHTRDEHNPHLFSASYEPAFPNHNGFQNLYIA